jgi:hypothetical protein
MTSSRDVKEVFQTIDGKVFARFEDAENYSRKLYVSRRFEEILEKFASTSLDDTTPDEYYTTEKGLFEEFIPALANYLALHGFIHELPVQRIKPLGAEPDWTGPEVRPFDHWNEKT